MLIVRTLKICIPICIMIWFLLFIVRSTLILDFNWKASRWWNVRANLCSESWRCGSARSAFFPFSRHQTSLKYHSNSFSGSQGILYCPFSTLYTCEWKSRYCFVEMSSTVYSLCSRLLCSYASTSNVHLRDDFFMKIFDEVSRCPFKWSNHFIIVFVRERLLKN